MTFASHRLSTQLTARNFLPVLVASGSAWAAGNAQQFGNYVRFGDLVFVTARIVMGDTTTFGTGNYTTTLPVAADVSGGELRTVGRAFFNNQGTNVQPGQIEVIADGTSATLTYDDGVNALLNVGAAAPFTWADTDVLVFQLVYQSRAVS